MEIRTLNERGVILFIGKKDTSYLSLALHSSLLELRLLPSKQKNVQGELITIRSNRILGKGEWHKIRIGKYGRKIYLFVDNTINTGLLDPKDTLSIPSDKIFLGGARDLADLPPDATYVLPTPFQGCIRHLSINFKRRPLIADQIQESRNVGDCDGTPCGGEYCENGGTCWLDPLLKAQCTCREPYWGQRCENLPSCENNPCKNNGACLNSRCSCQLGYDGAFCETAITVKVPKFEGRSYLLIDKPVGKKRDAKDPSSGLFLNFTTVSPRGLILWTEKDKNYVGVGLENGYLKVVYSSGKTNKYVEMSEAEFVADGLWHSVEVSFFPFVIKLDKTILHIQKDYEGIGGALSDGTYYLGGLPKNHSAFQEVHSVFQDNFDGCVAGFGTNSRNAIKDFTNFKGENVGVCSVA